MNGIADQSSLLIPEAAPGASPLESVPPDEAATIAVIRRNIEATVRAGAAKTGRAIRDEHPKAHGCARGTFEVLADLPAAYAVGLFATPRTYPAWVRFSNASGNPRPDSAGDGRGVAIKLIGVEASRSGTQDFVFMNGPRFFLRHAAQALDFNQAAGNQLKFFLPGWNIFRFRLHEFIAAMSITHAKMTNPLNVRYWSVTSYLFGEAACKYSLIPVGPLAAFTESGGPNYLRDNLVKSLAQADAVFDFAIQLRGPSMPVEDPTIEWREAEAPFVNVARLTIPRQSIDDPERLSLGENLSFTPWHGLDAHRPLGGINRVRRGVYEAISGLRHALNQTTREEPES